MADLTHENLFLVEGSVRRYDAFRNQSVFQDTRLVLANDESGAKLKFQLLWERKQDTYVNQRQEIRLFHQTFNINVKPVLT